MSSYPNHIDQFVAKINKRSVPHVVHDEALTVHEGTGEKFLNHDNVREDTLEIWTGQNKTGDRVVTYTCTYPEEEKWKTFVRVLTAAAVVYISYEAQGDQIEAYDINELQTGIVSTQTEVDRHKQDTGCHLENGIVDGGSFT